jgi:hypothetical protein
MPAAEAAAELESVIVPRGAGAPIERLSAGLDGYLGWIEAHARAWSSRNWPGASHPARSCERRWRGWLGYLRQS